MRPSHLALLAASILFSGCATGARSRPARMLPPDSLRVLERAIRMARPAFATQDEALRSGIYAVALPIRPEPTAPHPAAPLPARGALAPQQAYVIQLAAFRDRASAEIAADAARRELASHAVSVEEGEGWVRVVLSGWASAVEAETELVRVRAAYPSAWVRRRVVP